jgi:HEAT repeat protein
MRAIFLASCLAAAVAAGCSWPPAEQSRRATEAAEEFDRTMNAEAAAWKAKAEADFKARIADPGTIAAAASDALAADLESADPAVRARAAASLADAKGARGVDPLIRALGRERDEATFVTILRALIQLHDPRAVDAFVRALERTDMPDRARVVAVNGIIRFRSAWRLGSEIRRFYDGVTDPEVRIQLAGVVERRRQ